MSKLGFGMLALSLMAAGCSGNTAGTELRSRGESASTLTSETKGETQTTEITKGMIAPIVNIEKSELTHGNVTMGICGPDGSLFGEKTYTEPINQKEKIILELDRGKWGIVNTHDNASGYFHFVWDAHEQRRIHCPTMRDRAWSGADVRSAERRVVERQ